MAEPVRRRATECLLSESSNQAGFKKHPFFSRINAEATEAEPISQ
jgi:hypothetical protein